MYAQGQDAEIDYSRYQTIINTLFFNLSKIMENNRASEIVFETYMLADNAVRNNQVGIRMDAELKTVLTGMNFAIFDTGEICFGFGRVFLDTYHPDSGIHYAILIHEYRHLHDYLINGENYVAARQDEKEAYWYELDALRIEVEFIKYYLYGNFELSAFESLVLNSFENDNLNIASVLIFRESMDGFFYFHNLEMNFLQNNISKEAVINYLEQTGNGLISLYNEETEPFMAYLRFIEISTYRKYLPRIFVTLMNNPTMTWFEVYELHPKPWQIYNEMSEIMDKERENQSQFLSLIHGYWETDIMSRSRQGL